MDEDGVENINVIFIPVLLCNRFPEYRNWNVNNLLELVIALANIPQKMECYFTNEAVSVCVCVCMGVSWVAWEEFQAEKFIELCKTTKLKEWNIEIWQRALCMNIQHT